MPRAPRVEYEGAFYHIMCRGDRREPIFLSEEDKRLFLKTLGQGCERAGLVVDAFALMTNHYHLLLETPAGNLVAGMRWFQTTYTARFNARHRLSGHLFQGRYKALLIDPEEPDYGRQAADYIHLNPVRAGLVKTECELAHHPWSSYRFYAMGGERPGWLRIARIYGDHGLRPERVRDRRRFRSYMAGRIAQEVEGLGAPGGQESAWGQIRKGWVLGGEVFRERMEEMVSGVVSKAKRESFSGAEVRRHDRAQAELLLARGLASLGLGIEEVRAMKKNDVRKQGIAWLLKGRSVIGNEWICRTLRMGDRSNVNRAQVRFELGGESATKRIRRTLQQCAD